MARLAKHAAVFRATVQSSALRKKRRVILKVSFKSILIDEKYVYGAGGQW
jgi:hypothetical protein